MKLNLPNKITVSRILLIPIIIFFYLASSFMVVGKLIATILFAIACLTDFLDGYFARKLNQVTTLGKFLDSIADKMLVLTGLVLIVADNTIVAPYGVITAIIIIFRELMISALRQLAATKNVVIAADMWGKIKANFQFFAVMIFMLFAYFMDIALLTPGWIMAFEIVSYSLLFITVLSTVISGIHYCVANKQIFSDKPIEEEKTEKAEAKAEAKAKEEKKEETHEVGVKFTATPEETKEEEK